MTKDEIMLRLAELGSEQTKKVFKRHGAKEPFYGVKVQDLKKIVKQVKKNHQLSLDLYETGNSDAQYLAGLIADETKITPTILNKWVKKSGWYMISDYAVASVTAESPHAIPLAKKWIDSKDEMTASAGWSVLSNYLSITPNEDIDIQMINQLLQRVADSIDDAQNREKYAMNGFVIAAGSYVPDLTEKAIQLGEQIGKVDVYMGKTSCKVPFPPDYIRKIESKGRIGKKRKIARC